MINARTSSQAATPKAITNAALSNRAGANRITGLLTTGSGVSMPSLTSRMVSDTAILPSCPGVFVSPTGYAFINRPVCLRGIPYI